jgi:hypothetical protein
MIEVETNDTIIMMMSESITANLSINEWFY